MVAMFFRCDAEEERAREREREGAIREARPGELSRAEGRNYGGMEGG